MVVGSVHLSASVIDPKILRSHQGLYGLLSLLKIKEHQLLLGAYLVFVLLYFALVWQELGVASGFFPKV